MKLLFYLLSLLSFSLGAQSLEGKVVRIIDGDTFTMAIHEDTIIIRLHGIDCPENNQPFSQQAEDFLSNLILGKQVKIEKKGNDRYRRVIAIVTLDATSVNEALLKDGLAWHYKKYDKNPEWNKLEDIARKEKKGLWTQPNAIPPWEWRRRDKN